ncbi:MAG: hypothetical protein K8U57_28475 [Planctomycetes bacterium]|nr:hypothetical protein [Planctomycetota bacterium]
MTEVRLRNVEPWVVEVIRQIAKRKNRSTEEEIKAQLFALASREKSDLLAELRIARDDQLAKHGVLPDSSTGIREERESR